MTEIEKDLDIALYKLFEALQAGLFEPKHYENLNGKLNELRARQAARTLLENEAVTLIEE